MIEREGLDDLSAKNRGSVRSLATNHNLVFARFPALGASYMFLLRVLIS